MERHPHTRFFSFLVPVFAIFMLSISFFSFSPHLSPSFLPLSLTVLYLYTLSLSCYIYTRIHSRKRTGAHYPISYFRGPRSHNTTYIPLYIAAAKRHTQARALYTHAHTYLVNISQEEYPLEFGPSNCKQAKRYLLA